MVTNTNTEIHRDQSSFTLRLSAILNTLYLWQSVKTELAPDRVYWIGNFFQHKMALFFLHFQKHLLLCPLCIYSVALATKAQMACALEV